MVKIMNRIERKIEARIKKIKKLIIIMKLRRILSQLKTKLRDEYFEKEVSNQIQEKKFGIKGKNL